MNYSFVDPWHQFLPREGGHVIGFCGSGGKTSLMSVMASWYTGEGVPLILTTTTRTEPLVRFPVADVEDDKELANLANEPVFFLRAGLDKEEKWVGLLPESVDGLGDGYPERVVLAEVDGAGKKPVKFYRPGEPVWPARTSLAVVVMGLDALGEKAKNAVFRFGRENYPPLNELEPDTFWTWDHFYSLLTGPGGYLDQVPSEVPIVLALAGMGELADSIGLFEFMGRAMAHPRIPLALFCETSGDEPSLRAVCRLEEDSEK